MCIVPIAFFGTIMWILAPHIIAFFNSDPVVVNYGTYCLRFVLPFYFVQCVNQVITAALRGIGDTFVPMIIMVGCFVLVRQLYLYIVTNYIVNIPIVVVASFPVGWSVALIFSLIRYFRTDFDGRFAKLKDK